MASRESGPPSGQALRPVSQSGSFIIAPDDRILVTGAAGFIGARIVENLVDRGFRNLICLVRPSSDVVKLEASIKSRPPGTRIEVLRGNLLSRADCEAASKDATVIYHLAAGTGEKSFPDAFMNSVLTTRNLLDATRWHGCLRRFVLVSSFSVYTNRQKSRRLDESCPIEENPELRGDPYCYGKVKQEETVREYGNNFRLPYVVVRPGSVYGPSKDEITGRVGLSKAGLFLHLGGPNPIPLTYVDNCADAIILAGLVQGIEGEVFNIVDDELPSSRQFLRQYMQQVRPLRSVYVPHVISYVLCSLWEKSSQWSNGRLPLILSRRRWYAYWKKTFYSNEKLKARLGWIPRVSTFQGMQRCFRGSVRAEKNTKNRPRGTA